MQPHAPGLQPDCLPRLQPHAPRLQPHAPGLQPHAPRLHPHAPRLQPHAPRLQPYVFGTGGRALDGEVSGGDRRVVACLDERDACNHKYPDCNLKYPGCNRMQFQAVTVPILERVR